WVNLTVQASLRYATGDRTGGWEDLEKTLRIGGRYKFFPLRHAINMAISDGDIERAIKLMVELSTSETVNKFYPGTTAHIEKLVPLLKSGEDTLAFLRKSHVKSEVDNPTGDWAGNWTTDLYWAAYYGDYELAEAIFDSGTSYDASQEILDTTWFNYPIINPLRNSAAYKHLVKSINLDDFWRENGFPANCRPIGDDDFACN
ncbi:MAG: hypothetical protein WBN41_00285, partial [Lysobacterales bacterium]